jgi:hypothetical protein
MEQEKEIQVEAIDLNKRNSAFNVPDGEKVEGDLACYYNNGTYGEGSVICINHQRFVCNHYGRWENLHQPC